MFAGASESAADAWGVFRHPRESVGSPALASGGGLTGSTLRWRRRRSARRSTCWMEERPTERHPAQSLAACSRPFRLQAPHPPRALPHLVAPIWRSQVKESRSSGTRGRTRCGRGIRGILRRLRRCRLPVVRQPVESSLFPAQVSESSYQCQRDNHRGQLPPNPASARLVIFEQIVHIA